MTGGDVNYKTPTTMKSGQFSMRIDAATPVKNSWVGLKIYLAAQPKKKNMI